MTRFEAGQLDMAIKLRDWDEVRRLVGAAMREFAAEDRHNDWLELAEQSLQEAA